MKIEKVDPKEYDSELFKMLYTNEKEFEPDFSVEEWGLSEDQNLEDLTDREVVRENFEAIFYRENVEVLVCFDKEDPIAFLVVDTDFESKDLPEKMTPCSFVLLTLVDKGYRGKGIATEMNKEMSDKIEFNHPWIARRTQKQNKTSKSYIESLGFKEITRTQEQGCEQIYYGMKKENFKHYF